MLEALKKEFPKLECSTDPGDLETYGKDWTRVYSPKPLAVVFPRSTDEVSKLLKFCNDTGIAVVPSGGRTGLSGGAVASNGELVLSLSKMNRMQPVDRLAQTVVVEAGAVTEAVHEHCAPHGLTWPVDFASKGSSQVGGNIATNAGGVKVIRYGLTRQWVLGIKAVLMNGTVLELNGALEKNNTGLDLRQIFIGSEGILGIITEATLKLTRLPGKSDVFFFALKNFESVLALFKEARRAPFTISAFECLSHACLESVLAHRSLKAPFQAQHSAYVLMEVESDDARALEGWLETAFEKSWVEDGTLAQSPTEARSLWALREGISESLAARGMVHKNDIALPIAELDSFVAKIHEIFSAGYPDLQVFLFGHIGDGNLHLNVLKPQAMSRDEFLARCASVDQKLFVELKNHHGSISAEHGIGLLKKKMLHFSRTPEEIALFKSLKKAFDPKGLLNPGKIFD